MYEFCTCYNNRDVTAMKTLADVTPLDTLFSMCALADDSDDIACVLLEAITIKKLILEMTNQINSNIVKIRDFELYKSFYELCVMCNL